jgi:MFS superfamily sulfate permease-like transporter
MYLLLSEYLQKLGIEDKTGDEANKFLILVSFISGFTYLTLGALKIGYIFNLFADPIMIGVLTMQSINIIAE